MIWMTGGDEWDMLDYWKESELGPRLSSPDKQEEAHADHD